jgi:hypothetical protein
VEVIHVSWIIILHAQNLLFLDFLFLVFKCMKILVGYPLVIPSISDLTDQSEEQTEARILLIRLFFSVYSLN